MTAIITSIDDTANAAVIDESVPDIYRASISRGSVNVSPLVFDNAFTAPNSPHFFLPYRQDPSILSVFNPKQICSGLARYTIIKQVNNFYLISMLLKKMAVIYIFTLI